MKDSYVLVFLHKGETTQLPTPPPQKKKKKWSKTVVRFVVMYLLEKSITRIF